MTLIEAAQNALAELERLHPHGEPAMRYACPGPKHCPTARAILDLAAAIKIDEKRVVTVGPEHPMARRVSAFELTVKLDEKRGEIVEAEPYPDATFVVICTACGDPFQSTGADQCPDCQKHPQTPPIL